ncbi:hypothetical protein Cgig2_017615 [Carnegiea gigantea]|uniref:Uncharacterized protein n=1 Tax=Carnegiea gigantea TaxID=171969 RepID=A0A9Q1Q983_9CARY|nr:hypothetical protein Cgig2_017615 [Carnegiea gigantea]
MACAPNLNFLWHFSSPIPPTFLRWCRPSSTPWTFEQSTMGRMMLDLQELRWGVIETILTRGSGTPRFPTLLRWSIILNHAPKDVPEGLAGPQVEGPYLQFLSLLAFIDGRKVVGIPQRINVGNPKRFPTRSGFIMVIENKLKVKYRKYDFLFVPRESGLGNIPDWNGDKPVRNPFG